ncbi:uncharacterized protein LOC119399602 isoform X4 [Rhipicephalus sanguineus]|nr:uncharacterized protein LOC119399602 isoform X4 [Rhipicephalus sanguineus]
MVRKRETTGVDFRSTPNKVVDPAMQDQERPACLGFCGALRMDEDSIKMEIPLATIGNDVLRPLAGPCETIGRPDTACQTEPEPLGGLVVLLSATDGSEASTQVSHVVQCDKVTQETESGRSALQCAQQCSRRPVKCHNKGPFSEEENRRLLQLAAICTKGGNICWEEVAHFMRTRSKKQLMRRYYRSMDPSVQHGPWTAPEDVMLLIAFKLYGDIGWSKVASMLPGRTGNQCRERYKNTLTQRCASGPYTPDEDYTLLELVQKHGVGHWTKVARDMPWRAANSAMARYRRLCETLGVEQPTVADLKLSRPGPVAPVMNAAQCAQLTGLDKRMELYRYVCRLLDCKIMRRATLMLVKGQDESVDRETCLKLYREMLRFHWDSSTRGNTRLLRLALNKAIAQYAQPMHRATLPSLAAYERQEWHAVANVLHDLHGLPRPPPNPDVEEVGTVPVFEEFFSKEVLDVPEGFQSNDSSLVLPLLPPNEVGAGKDRLSDDTKSSCKSHEHKTWLQLAWLDCSARSQKTTVPTFGKLSDRFVNGNLTESLSALQDDNSFPELSAALDANSIEDIRCTECTSRSLLELSSIAARASQESCFRCSELRATRKNFEVLQARFVSYFFWPALLDTVNVAEMVELPSGTYEKGPKKYRKRSRIKRPWVKEMWKERKRLASAAAVAGAAAEGIDAPQEDCDGGPSGTSAMLA